MNRDILSELSAFFPMAVYTGHKLVMLSPEHEVTISRACGSEPFCPASVQRRVIVEVWRTSEDTEKKLSRRESFEILDIRQLAAELEKYIENALDISIKAKSI
ncbi:MAG: hypothetical protein AB7F23_06685 [Phycisphaerae bacterium]|jgi:hypothetical protein